MLSKLHTFYVYNTVCKRAASQESKVCIEKEYVAPDMVIHENESLYDNKIQNFHGEGDTPSPNPTPSAPSALRFSRLRHS